jgi:zinc-ribbon domain
VADIPGKYIREKTSAHYIELKADGSYFLFDGSAGITGNYEVNGSEITIFIGDATSQGTIQDGIIIDDEGEKWLRTSAVRVDSTVLKCRNCGSDILETVKFCSNCGAQIDAVEPIPINRARAAYRPQATLSDSKTTDDPLVSMTWLPAVVRRDDFPWELIEAAVGLVLIIALFAVIFGHTV